MTVFIGSTLAGTTPLVNNQGQVVNPNPIGRPASYGIVVPVQSTAGTAPAMTVIGGFTNPMVNNMGQIINPTPTANVIQNPAIMPPMVISGALGNAAGGGGDSGSSGLNNLIVPLLIILGVLIISK